MKPALVTCTALLFLGLRWTALSHANEVNLLTIDEIRDRILHFDGRLESLYADFRIDGYSDRYPDDYYSHQRVYWQDPSLLYQLSAHGHPQLDWQDDPTQQEAFIVENHFFRFNDVNRTVASFNIDADSQQLPGMFEASSFFVATGLWPHQRWRAFRPMDTPVILREVAQDDAYRLAPGYTTEGGRPCQLLERENRDRLWFDFSDGIRLMRREMLDPDSGQVVQEFLYAKHQEILDGFHFAMEITVKQFGKAAVNSTYRGTGRERIAQLRFFRVVVNEEDFDGKPELALEEGMLLLEDGNSPQQVRSGGEAHLSHIARWVMKYAPTPTPAPVSPPGWRFTLVCLAFVFAAILGTQLNVAKLVSSRKQQ